MSPRTARPRFNSPAFRRWMRCPTLCGWNRTWSSNSIRADPEGQFESRRATPCGAALFLWLLADRLIEELAYFHQHLCPNVAVVQLVLEFLVAKKLHRRTCLLESIGHLDAVCVPYVEILVSMHQQNRRLDDRGMLQRRPLLQ